MHIRKRADVTTTPLPRPTVVPPSGDFDGNDGRWSTFFVNINSDSKGVNGQNFKVLISTSSPITLVPDKTDGCDETCAAKRGILSDDKGQPDGVEQTNNRQEQGIYELKQPYWWSNDFITGNQSLRGTGYTTNVGLGRSSSQSDVLVNRFAMTYIFKEYFLGYFGLAAGTVEIGPDATKNTFLQQFRNDDAITSASYGYTAGAAYRNSNRGELGNLVLGGYDKSRMVPAAGISIRMPSIQNNTLAIGIPSIIYTPDPNVVTNKISFTQSCGGFQANIDSTLPYLILPDCICDQFQETFGLKYDETRNLYFMDDSVHDRNVQQNGTVDIKIAEGTADSFSSTVITLGYPAFDMQLSSATGGNATNYFPIKKSKNGIYTLGRTFLQEAYIVVDYERLNFTVAPAHYSDPMPAENLVTIFNKTYTLGGPENTSNSGGGLGTGAIAGTVVGIVVAFAIAGVLAFCWWRKRKIKKAAAQQSYETQQIDPTLADQEVKYRRVSELTGSDLPHSPKTPLAGYYTADHKSVPPISEMSPDSPPVELYSPPPESANDVDGGRDYFTAGKPNRRGAQRDRASSGHNTPGTPIAELPGDDAQFYTPGVSPLNSPIHSHGPSDTSLSTNIDERLADQKKGATTARPTHPAESAATEGPIGPKNDTKAEAATETTAERPPHQRGLSDTTIASDSTAVSQPTPEEEARWAREPSSGGRPLSQ
ncbi:hypothetical protein N0V91_004276 [Didymella pomorum]|uniref:Peptidase A1 domain-containing protein n=1 Tax=Didymella pomorum TaxID=749634 RepID=A0A9W9D7S0_9PLEO|nr:hypothetical protein N0V91_004276 [Didymella pomorum]